MAKELSGYGPTAGESMGGTGANLNQQGGNNNSNSGVHWGVVQALVMEVVNMEVRRGGDGVKPIIRMCRLMLMIMGRCALPSQMVW